MAGDLAAYMALSVALDVTADARDSFPKLAAFYKHVETRPGTYSAPTLIGSLPPPPPSLSQKKDNTLPKSSICKPQRDTITVAKNGQLIKTFGKTSDMQIGAARLVPTTP